MTDYAVDLQTMSVGLLVARLVVGIVMAAHGTQKLFGWFGGYGLRKTGEFFGGLGFTPGYVFAGAASVAAISDLLSTGDPEQRVRAYLQRLAGVNNV